MASPRSGLADDPLGPRGDALLAGAYRLGDVACLMLAIEAAGLALAAARLPSTGVATTVLTYRLVSFWAVVAVGWMMFSALRRWGRMPGPAQSGADRDGRHLAQRRR